MSRISIDRGRYSVPEDIVLRYDVHIKKPLLFSDLIIVESNCFLDTSGQLKVERVYVRKDLAVMIVTVTQNETECVATLKFSRGKTGDRVSCANITSS